MRIRKIHEVQKAKKPSRFRSFIKMLNNAEMRLLFCENGIMQFFDKRELLNIVNIEDVENLWNLQICELKSQKNPEFSTKTFQHSQHFEMWKTQ